MAYAIIAGLSPVCPVCGRRWSPSALYAILGTSRWLSLRPEIGVAVMAAAIIVPLVAAAFTSANAAAALALAGGVDLGWWPACCACPSSPGSAVPPILVGYMAGIAVLMIDNQIDRVCSAFTPDSGHGLRHV